MSIKDLKKKKCRGLCKGKYYAQELRENVNYYVQYIDWYLNVEPTHLFHIQKRVIPILIHFL
jgi:hypothetical protein